MDAGRPAPGHSTACARGEAAKCKVARLVIDDFDELQDAHKDAPEAADALITVAERLVERDPPHKRAAVLVAAASHVVRCLFNRADQKPRLFIPGRLPGITGFCGKRPAAALSARA